MNKLEFQEMLNKIEPNRLIDQNELDFIMVLMLNDKKGIDYDINNVTDDLEIYKSLQVLLRNMVPRIFKLRLEQHTTLSIATNAFWSLCGFMDTPGHAVMYAYYLKHKLPENTFIDMNVLYQQVFPYTFFSDDQLNDIWDAQKVDQEEDMSDYTCIGAPDNKLDYLEFWK